MHEIFSFFKLMSFDFNYSRYASTGHATYRIEAVVTSEADAITFNECLKKFLSDYNKNVVGVEINS